jgi:aryl-alcohol dehydrogenase-like predicted oxidoreductase
LAATRREMEKLVAEGKVVHWGISINDHAPETALRALRDPLFASAQVIYNIFDRSPEKELFDLARAKNIGIIVRVPFDEGTLTGTVRPDTRFPDGDWRHRYFSGNRRAEAARRADALVPLLGDGAKTLPELALRFILSRPEVSTVIPGMRRAAHARANAAVSDGRLLDSALLEKLEGHAWEKNWYGG